MFLQRSECRLEAGMLFYRLDGDIKITGLVHRPLCKITEGEIAKRLLSSMKISVAKGKIGIQDFLYSPE